MSEWGLVNMILTEGVVRRVIGCVGRGRVAIGSCYRERRNGEKEERGGAGRRREWERGEGGGGRKEVGREEGRERIKATGNELTQAKTKTLERLGHEYPHLNKRSHLATLESPACSLDKAFRSDRQTKRPLQLSPRS